MGVGIERELTALDWEEMEMQKSIPGPRSSLAYIVVELQFHIDFADLSRVVFTADELNWTELTSTKLTQLHHGLLVTHVSVTKLIGCRAAVRALQFANYSSGTAVQFSSVCLPWTRLYKRVLHYAAKRARLSAVCLVYETCRRADTSSRRTRSTGSR